MISYLASKSYSRNEFDKVVDIISTKYSDFVKRDLIEDIDGTLIQPFEKGKDEINVLSDEPSNCICVDSTIEINVKGFEKYYED